MRGIPPLREGVSGEVEQRPDQPQDDDYKGDEGPASENAHGYLTYGLSTTGTLQPGGDLASGTAWRSTWSRNFSLTESTWPLAERSR